MRLALASFFILTSFASLMASAQSSVGFSTGNIFKMVAITGQVTVTCNENNQVNYTCRDVVLDPAGHAFLIGPENVEADEVDISVARADGTVRTASENYIKNLSRTEGTFNLWEPSLLEKPLLKEGQNTVTYSFTKGSKTILAGNFVASVTRGTPRTCPKSSYNSPFPEDCGSQYSVCQNYFEQFNYCR